MKPSDFHLYTIAKGQRFIDAAVRCAYSFVEKNPGMRFTVFVIGKNDFMFPKNPNIMLEFTKLPKYFTPEIMEKKPCADILFFKYADAPFMLETNARYIGQVDADCLCMCKLPIEYIAEYLKANYFLAATDPKVEVNKQEIFPYENVKWKLYFNSGVCFWPRKFTKEYLGSYKEWTLDNIEHLIQIPYADQTWMNIYMNHFYADALREIGWYWNFRGCVRHPRAYIWHAGGRDSEGIEMLAEEFESWK